MPEDAPTIGDIHQWFDQLALLPIGESAALFFSKLGYICDNEIPLVDTSSPNRFVYTLLPADKLLNDKDRAALKSVDSCAKLTTFCSCDYSVPSVDVDIYAVDLKDCGSTRSEDAYNVHEVISKFNDHLSVVFFRCAGEVMLSFLRFAGEDGLSIRLSDWFSSDSVDNGQIDRMNIASCSLVSAYDLFDSMEFESIRHYYKYPITRYIAAYDIVFQSLNLSLLIDTSGFTREAQNDAIQKALDTYPDMYGDDYIDDEVIEIGQEEDIDLDELEWEAQKLELTEGHDDDDVADELDYGDDVVTHYPLPPSEVMNDPIALLDWVESHKEPQPSHGSSGTAGPAQRHAVSIGENPPPIGSHVRHIRLGEGVVDGVRGGHHEDDTIYVSAMFGDTARSFVFPGAFENGLVQLLA